MPIKALILPDIEGEIRIKNKGFDHEHFLRVQNPPVICGYCKSREHELGVLIYDLPEDVIHKVEIELDSGWKQDPVTGIFHLTEYAKKRVRRGKTPRFHTGVRDKRGDFYELRGYEPRHVLSYDDWLALAHAKTEHEHQELMQAFGVRDVRLRPRYSVSSPLPALVRCPNPRCGWINEVVELPATA
jgi:hypothetical protein